MYAILQTTATGWLTTARMLGLGNGIAKFCSGTAFNSITEFTGDGVTLVDYVKDGAEPFWTAATGSGKIYSPCDVASGARKYVQFQSLSNGLRTGACNTENGTYSAYDLLQSTNTYETALASNKPLRVHISMSPRHLAIGFENNNPVDGKFHSIMLCSEVTFPITPYMNTSTTMIPALINNANLTVKRFANSVPANADNQMKFIGSIINNQLTGAQSAAGYVCNVVVNHGNHTQAPLTSGRAGISQRGADLKHVMSIMPWSATSTESDSCFFGSITDKSGIYLSYGNGIAGDNLSLPGCDSVYKINGNNYVFWDALVVPYK